MSDAQGSTLIGRGHGRPISRLRWAPDGRHLASVSFDGAIRVWLADKSEPVSEYMAHRGTDTEHPRDVAWSPDGKWLVSCGSDSTVRCWEAQTGHTRWARRNISGRRVLWMDDGRVLCLGDRAHILSADNGQSGRAPILSDVVGVTTLDIGDEIVVVGRDGRLTHVEVGGRSTRPLPGRLPRAPAADVVRLPNGELVAAGMASGELYLWACTLFQPPRTLSAHDSGVKALSVSHDGGLLASKSQDGTIRIWDTRRWQVDETVDEPASSFVVEGLAFHPHRRLLVSLAEGGTVMRAWEPVNAPPQRAAVVLPPSTRVVPGAPALSAAPDTEGTTSRKWDVFISHASEDKETVARPLAEALTKRGVRVWFDAEDLLIGDSLMGRISDGLVNSRYGVAILSDAFFSKKWPQYELSGFLSREMVPGGQTVLLPIRHDITPERVVAVHPALADRLSPSTADGINALAEQIAVRVKAEFRP